MKNTFFNQIISLYSDMEIIWCEPNSNWIYALFFLIYSSANIYLNFVKVTLGNKFFPFNFSRGKFVNSSFYTSFINDKNEEIWVEILSYVAEPNARTFTQGYIRHLEILLSLLFCVSLILLYRYEWVNIHLKVTPLHRGVNLLHFWILMKYTMKLTCWMALNQERLTGTQYSNEMNYVTFCL